MNPPAGADAAAHPPDTIGAAAEAAGACPAASPVSESGAGPDSDSATVSAAELVRRARRDARESLARWRPRALAGRTSYRQRVVGAAALVAAVSGIFGGLQGVPAQAAVPQVPVGTPIDTPQWRVTVEKVQLYRPDAFAPTLRISQPGRHWLVVVTTMAVAADEPMTPAAGSGSAAKAAVTLPDEPGLNSANPDQVLIVSDGTVNPTLQPGVPEQVAFFWEQQDSAGTTGAAAASAGQPASGASPSGTGSSQPGTGPNARVEVNSEQQRRWVTNQELRWGDPAAKAVVVAPIRPFPAGS
ncbi:hypothetical protein [Nakamurella aerolata]|uniref:Uncharacterized protein n=1 Tax=Nakamurella aerolata TaxID=1656892 RepID=A0A849A6J3_9ACTN|nr:hypothetical protein [Nakamurella aerolata]NNG36135.1 hypothetical protein [Nakamurella aerolata]